MRERKLAPGEYDGTSAIATYEIMRHYADIFPDCLSVKWQELAIVLDCRMVEFRERDNIPIEVRFVSLRGRFQATWVKGN
jgi:hypothetical protein